MEQIQYISDDQNKVVGVIVPIDLWREIESEKKQLICSKIKRYKNDC